MVRGFVICFPSFMVACAVAAGIRRLWTRCPRPETRDDDAGFRRWLMRGFGVPVAAWMAWDALALWGPAWGLTPLAPQTGEGPAPAYTIGLAAMLLLTSVAWACCSLAWLIPETVKGVRRMDDLRACAILIGVPVILAGIGCMWSRKWLLLALLMAVGLWIFLEAALSLVHVPRVSYARAVARMKSGRYSQAEQEILVQLEEKADDYEGWMLLATLYAEQFGQLAEAAETIQELCSQPGLSPYQVSHAYTRLAEWQLERASNTEGAKAALTEIVTRCAGTPFAVVAEHRRRQLPLDDEELRELRRPRSLRLPAFSSPPGSTLPGSDVATHLDAMGEASRLAARVAARPGDPATRLRLARVLAESLNRVDEAIRHLQDLRSRGDATQEQTAESIALEASWELRLRGRKNRARLLLESLIRDHPETPQCLTARRQIDLLEQEATIEVPRAPEAPPPPIRIVIPNSASSDIPPARQP